MAGRTLTLHLSDTGSALLGSLNSEPRVTPEHCWVWLEWYLALLESLLGKKRTQWVYFLRDPT